MARGQQRARSDRECSAERYADLIRRLSRSCGDLADGDDLRDRIAKAKADREALLAARLRLSIPRNQRDALKEKAVRCLKHCATCLFHAEVHGHG